VVEARRLAMLNHCAAFRLAPAVKRDGLRMRIAWWLPGHGGPKPGPGRLRASGSVGTDLRPIGASAYWLDRQMVARIQKWPRVVCDAPGLHGELADDGRRLERLRRRCRK
jgi:hypothetical protein